MDNIIEPPKLPEELADVKQGRLVSHHLDQTCTHDEKSILRLQAIANNNLDTPKTKIDAKMMIN
ncbi:hypothetical protein ACJQWK_00489 [Exserohilum turcicum]